MHVRKIRLSPAHLILETLSTGTQDDMWVVVPCTFDLEDISFMKPTGVIKLVLTARYIAEQSDHRVRLVNLKPDLQSYLERINLFEVAKEWLQLDEALPTDQRWERNPQTANLLELTPITNASDVARVMERAEAIFSRWLSTTIRNAHQRQLEMPIPFP